MKPLTSSRTARKLLLGTTALAIAAGVMMPLQGSAQATNIAPIAWTQPANLADLIEVVSPAVVKITATITGAKAQHSQKQMLPDNLPSGPMGELFKRFFEEQQGIPAQPRHKRGGQALGSGFIIESDGIIITNNHVVDGASKLKVTLKDGRNFDAELLGVDPKTDLAVLKITADTKLPTVGWGDSDRMRVGDPVFAVGAPYGLSGSVTSGIVSARGRDIGSGPYDDFIQVDAPINKGNSGGPLFNAEGNVVGVNTAIYSPTGGSIGIGFSIPSDLAKSVAADIVANGQVERGWLGVSIESVTTDIADSLGLDKAKGVIVDNVMDDSPAKAAGVKSGDIILGFGDTKIVDAGDLTLAVAEADIGKKAEMTVYRNGKEITLEPEIARLKADKLALNTSKTPMNNRFDGLGLALQSEGDSLIITDVDPDSSAATAGLREGDLLLSLNQKPVTSLSDVDEALAQAKEQNRPAILAQVERDGNRRFLALSFGAQG